MNNKIKLQMDTINYKEKPNDFSVIKPRIQKDENIREIDLKALMFNLSQGCSISPAVLKGGMCANNWTEQTIFMVDIDNANKDLPILTFKQALEICRNNNILPVFGYYTFSNTYQLPKYRLVFQMDYPITDTRIREKIISALIDLFPQSDKSCKNADRIFLGTNQEVIEIDLNSRLSIDDVLKTASFDTIYYNNDKGISDNELYNLKKNFNLLEYMCKENEVSRSTSGITYFSNCSICGHNDCLRYYHKSNTFYCFGSNGRKGGTIIDYLMLTENLTLKEAIKKFKVELCNIEDNNSYSTLEYISAEELQNMDLPEIIFYVSDLIPQGLTLICSVPKLGKSWLALQLCLSISRGNSFLNFNTKHSSCLYLALEDSKNRLKERTEKLLNGDTAPSNLYFNILNKDINNGLIEELNSFINQYPNVKIIVIDTLQKIRGTTKVNNAYANDYKELSKIKSFADNNQLAIILIHHLKKGIESNDVFDRVSGTNGITGTADTTIVLSKENRNDVETKMSIVGRDVELNEYIIKFNKDTCTWELINSVEDFSEQIKRHAYNTNTLILTIKHLLEENNNVWTGTLKSLNNEHLKLYDRVYANNEIKLKNELDKLESQLKDYDNIIYIPADKSPTKEGRIQTFKKII